MSSRAVQQERKRRGALRPVGGRHVQVAVARGAEHKRLQAERRRLHLCRTRPQTTLRSHILTCHKLSSIPAVLSGYTATLRPARTFHDYWRRSRDMRFTEQGHSPVRDRTIRAAEVRKFRHPEGMTLGRLPIELHTESGTRGW